MQSVAAGVVDDPAHDVGSIHGSLKNAREVFGLADQSALRISVQTLPDSPTGIPWAVVST